jgi:hypothetical protein
MKTEITITNATHANFCGYSDVRPYEIIRVVSDKCIEIRAMNAERSADWKPEFIVGGFAGHCTNNSQQRWDYSSNPEREIIRIRLCKRGKCGATMWRDKYKCEYRLSDHPVNHYDYNF